MLNLDNVTLLGVDCVNINDLITATEHCKRDINFASIKLLTHFPSNHPHIVSIEKVKSAQEYNYFCIKKMADYFDTDFVLNIEWDGYVLDASKWSDDFLNYDYVGAPWEWYKDDYKIGNGGFSLRSKRLQEILKNDSFISKTLPEDEAIGRTYRKYLEEKYNIKYAPIEVARQFSQESAYTRDRFWKGSFGWHGYCVDFSRVNVDPANTLMHIPKLRMKQ